MDKKLTPKQKAFCDYYIETGNATESAVRAGYSSKYAHTNANKLLQNTTIKNYIDKILTEISNKRIAKAEEVLEFLTSGLRGEIKDSFDMDASFSDRIKCAELLGKRYSLFTDKQKIEQLIKVEEDWFEDD